MWVFFFNFLFLPPPQVVCKREHQGQEGLSGQRTSWRLWLLNRDVPLVNSRTKELGPKKSYIFPCHCYLFVHFCLSAEASVLFFLMLDTLSLLFSPGATFSPESPIQSPSTCCVMLSLQTDPHDSSPWTGFPALPSSFLLFLLGWATRLAQS